MPTATNLLGLEPHNLGPLTTPAALPTSCTDKRYQYLARELESRTVAIGQPECHRSLHTECFPSGDGYQEKADKATRYWLDYYSPGYECPSGWKTMGIQEHGGKGDGVFTADIGFPNQSGEDFAQVLPMVAEYSAMLVESETAVWCCPSGMQADVDGQCFSSVGKLSDFPTITATCLQQFDSDFEPWATVKSLDGVSWTTPLLSYLPHTDQPTGYTTRAIDKEYLPPNVFVVEAQAAVVLIHKKEDKKEDDGGKDDDKKSAASAVGPTVFGAVSYIPVVAALTSVLASMILL